MKNNKINNNDENVDNDNSSRSSNAENNRRKVPRFVNFRKRQTNSSLIRETSDESNASVTINPESIDNPTKGNMKKNRSKISQRSTIKNHNDKGNKISDITNNAIDDYQRGELKIDGYSEGYLLEKSKEVVWEKLRHTDIFSIEADQSIPRFDDSELTLGKMLGRGGFCGVNEIIKIELCGVPKPSCPGECQQDEHRISNVIQDRQFMAQHYIRRGKDYRYAIKKLMFDVTNDAQTFINGIVDLAIEARYLSVIRHPNIIKMRAVSSGSPFSQNYYIILDRLYDILTRRLTTWKKKMPGRMAPMNKKVIFWVERITVAYEIASAINYLHNLRIIYRDLKPDNIGFDVRGDVKLFDFGLSRELPRQALDDGTYNMTGNTGSLRYMAPEVALDKSYSEKADIYSFGILLWQICSAEIPFEKFKVPLFRSKVVMDGFRPKVYLKWPKNIRDLLQACWDVDIRCRPNMREVVAELKRYLNANTDHNFERDVIDLSLSSRSARSLLSSGSGRS